MPKRAPSAYTPYCAHPFYPPLRSLSPTCLHSLASTLASTLAPTHALERFHPDHHIPDEIDTERDRVEFLLTAAEVITAKANVKLNLKKLYASDGHAVQELLKIASMLYVDDERD